MNVTITLEHRFSRTPDGSIWTVTAFPYAFWTRYLSVFDQVRIVARVLDVPVAPEDGKRVDGDGVTFFGVPYYHGPLQFAQRYRSVRSAVRTSIGPSDAVIMRVPSFLSMILEPMLHRRGQPFSLEVVGDPYAVFAPGVMRHPLRPVFRHYLTSALRKQCCRATGVAYVTKHALQKRYPCASLMTGVSDVELRQEAFSTHYSSIELTAGQLVKSSPLRATCGGKATLAFVGSLEQLYKGPDVLLKAMAANVAAGLDLSLLIVGDGKYRGMLQELAQRLKIAERCRFLGQLPAGPAVQEIFDSADLFVLPSRTEGLPRAMIEAMARSLPCIGSNVGGIPELLPEEDMVPAGDTAALARKIREFLSDPQRLLSTSQRNLGIARQYLDQDLQKRRTEFYEHTRAATQRWLNSRKSRQAAA